MEINQNIIKKDSCKEKTNIKSARNNILNNLLH